MTNVRNLLRRRLTFRQRRRLADFRIHLRRPSAALRSLPDFLVLGAQRCGTSTLYRSLIAHPQVAAPVRKEVNFFARRWGHDLGWYRSHFPLRIQGSTSFDCTPDYLFHPDAPERVLDTMGSPPMVVLLRDPVRRAWSHYQHNRRLSHEDLAFTDALDAEHSRLSRASAHERKAFWRYSYFFRGLYAEQLERWFAFHPRSRFLVLFFDDLITNHANTLKQIEAHVGLDPWAPPSLHNWSYTSGRPPSAGARLPSSCRDVLTSRFAEPDRKLSALLGRELPW